MRVGWDALSLDSFRQRHDSLSLCLFCYLIRLSNTYSSEKRKKLSFVSLFFFSCRHVPLPLDPNQTISTSLRSRSNDLCLHVKAEIDMVFPHLSRIHHYFHFLLFQFLSISSIPDSPLFDRSLLTQILASIQAEAAPPEDGAVQTPLLPETSRSPSRDIRASLWYFLLSLFRSGTDLSFAGGFPYKFKPFHLSFFLFLFLLLLIVSLMLIIYASLILICLVQFLCEFMV